MPNFKFTPKPHLKILPKPPKVRSFVFENDSRSKQDHDKLARELLDAILNNDYIYLMVDEGDGRMFWKYELDISGESLTAAQWNDEGRGRRTTIPAPKGERRIISITIVAEDWIKPMPRNGTFFFLNLWFNWKARNLETIETLGAVKSFEIFVYHHRHLALVCGFEYALKKYPHFFELKNL